jgi:predicted ATP-grasp superfamily ATP-dependent carboligase
MANILLTGGRAPVALDLARAFHRASHTVFMAESLRGHLSESSTAIQENFLVPPPRQQTVGFITALKDIVTQCKIDLLIPTGEEVFYVSMGRDQLPCKVFVDSIEKLHILHNKWHFILEAIDHDLSVPETALIKNLDDLLHAYAHWRGLVLKPVYSRFAAQTKILLPLKRAISSLTYESPWIAQEYVRGGQISTYSVCHNGHITAHTAYPSEFTTGNRATIVFQHINHAGIFEWVKKFVEAIQFTGQIGFDFMQTPEGHIFALECNPRATGGIYNLSEQPEFIDSFFNETMPTLIPNHPSSYMLSTAMFLYGLPASILNGRFIKWLRTFWTSNDVVLDDRDLKPFLLQYRGIFSYLKLAREHQISPLAASTYDIEWNGENGA